MKIDSVATPTVAEADATNLQSAGFCRFTIGDYWCPPQPSAPMFTLDRDELRRLVRS
jgi:hypothetical protein